MFKSNSEFIRPSVSVDVCASPRTKRGRLAVPHLGGRMMSGQFPKESQYLCTAIIQVPVRISLFIPESHRRPPHNPGPDYVTSPGVPAPSFSRSLSVSLPGKAFISLRHELKSSAFALCGTSCKRWTSPHCSLATASQSLHPCTTQSLLCKFLPPVTLSHSCSALWTASANRGSSLCLFRLAETHFLLLSDWLGVCLMMSSV